MPFFYDDFVVIKTRPGVELDKVNITFSFTVEQGAVNANGDDIYEGEVTYNFTNKDLNIRRCKDRQY
ncbi:MAG: hypothetical protein L7F77_09005 [Candidatus Magnetominusculus sp. LBB02]|nr:hypothetical protein [Candidatus Magnetominusculus sp. LBB02]